MLQNSESSEANDEKIALLKPKDKEVQLVLNENLRIPPGTDLISVNITYRKLFLDMARLSLPFLASRCVDVVRSFVGNIFLARLGSEYNSAGALISTTQLAILGTGLVSTYGLGISIGRASDAQPERLQQMFRAGLVLSLGIATLSLPIFLFSGPILNKLGQNSELTSITNEFYYGYGAGVPLAYIVATMQQYLLGRKDSNPVLYANLINTTASLISAYFLTNSVLGARGLGYSNSIGVGSSALVLSLYISCSKKHKANCLLGLHKIDWGKLKEDIKIFSKIGGTIAIRVGTELGGIFAGTLFIGWLGNAALGAAQVANQINFLEVAPLFALAQTTAVSVGRFLKSGDISSVKKVTRIGNAMAFSTSFLMGALIFTIPGPITSLFMGESNASNEDLRLTTRNLLYITASAQMLDGLRNVYGGVLNAAGDIKSPLISGITITSMLACLLGYLLLNTAGLGTEGVFYARLITIGIGALVMSLAFDKKMNELEGQPSWSFLPWLSGNRQNAYTVIPEKSSEQSPYDLSAPKIN